MMTEERTQYTTQSDELTQLRRQNRELSEKLDRQIAAWNANGDALTAHAERQAQRIAELEDRISYLNTTNSMRRTTIEEQTARIAELEATVAQLTAQLAAVPVTLLRYIVTSHPSLPIDDRLTAQRWLNNLDGAA